jgi:tRNA nucleotidyltransferase/poly(A) polymerase
MWRDALVRLFPALASLSPGCYVVGGAVRDLVLERAPADVDVACADPLVVAQALGRKVIRLGDQEHLSAYRVVLGEHVYDFAAILDGDIAVDLERRDFTVNAMAVDLDRDELLDPNGGRRDLEARVVRMVKASNFDDDPLRMLKGVRMAVKYDFTIDATTLDAIQVRAERIIDVAAERVSYELSVIFSSGALSKAIALLGETRLAHPLGLTLRDVAADDVSLAGAYALLVDDPRAHADRWRWSEALLRDVLTLRALIEKHDRLALYDAGERVARQLPAVLRALGRDDTLDEPDFTIRPLLTGDELAHLTGLPPGKTLGALKRALLEKQIAGAIRTKEEAIAETRPATAEAAAARELASGKKRSV